MKPDMLPRVENIPVKYHREPTPPSDRPARFLDAFAADPGALELPATSSTPRSRQHAAARAAP